MYVMLNLLVLRKFERKHGLALYEFLADYLNLGGIRCDIESFRKLMGVGPLQYPSFTMLRKRILDKAVGEINEKSDLEVSYELEHTGRKITAVYFTMKRKELPKDPDEAISEIRTKLLSYGLKHSTIDTLLENHDESYLWVNIAVVEEKYKKGKVKNVAGYLMKAFADNYSQQAEDQKQLAAKSIETSKPDLFETEARKRKEFEGQRRVAVEEFLSKQDDLKIERLQTSFEAKQSENVWYQSLKASKQFDHPMIQNIYYRYIATTQLAEKWRSYEDFKALSQVEVSGAINANL